MPEEVIVRQGAPTLAGIKTGSLFPVRYESLQRLLGEAYDFNVRLGDKGVYLLPVRLHQGRALLYLYRPAYLKQDFLNGETIRLLREMGYCCETVELCIARLIGRLQYLTEFPHEVGLFLGYPPEDVRGFIENKAKNFKCAGCWKVYGDADRAQRLFLQYRQCSQAYYAHWQRGSSIERLTVAV